jgi:hypothetical protein
MRTFIERYAASRHGPTLHMRVSPDNAELGLVPARRRIAERTTGQLADTLTIVGMDQTVEDIRIGWRVGRQSQDLVKLRRPPPSASDDVDVPNADVGSVDGQPESLIRFAERARGPRLAAEVGKFDDRRALTDAHRHHAKGKISGRAVCGEQRLFALASALRLERACERRLRKWLARLTPGYRLE